MRGLHEPCGGTGSAGLFVFLIFDEDFYSVADFNIGIVAEFADGNNAVALVADVNHCLTLVERDDGTFDYFL